ncbi:ABC transporter substrate-binding protein [Nitrococcus mobilis]|uniref:Probable ABC transporter, substrate-binding protein n=1 Tax=Nitrococcus mobilis Nb-231 TaxID=314278 RepID=A4BRV0_9GAMM|nr:ABC transporter substrate-binding protein [Nitrococcus mobilis]EAR21671.1 probable ABC transporter, substrate-binding protein [Nitrococcus mobilis Nb-231]
MRVVSLLPSATEIVYALGRQDDLVGVSHDCDFPAAVEAKPRVTSCELTDTPLDSAAIDRWVSERLARGEPLFHLNRSRLESLRPELILTQSLCQVCAPSAERVTEVAAALPEPPRVLNLEASTLAGVLDTIEQVAVALGATRQGGHLIGALQQRVAAVVRGVARAERRPRVALLEWLDPVYCAGHWTPELITIAGGVSLLGELGEPSLRLDWQAVREAQPEVLVIACCGQTAERAARDWIRLAAEEPVRALDAVRNEQVYLVDGNAYFNRPGPRLIDSMEILAGILHPELFPLPGAGKDVVRANQYN